MICLLAQRSEESERVANWPLYARRVRTLNLIAVPAWWSISGAFIELSTNRGQILAWPRWVLLVLPLSIGITLARILTIWTGCRIDGRHWTIRDSLRLSAWGSLASTVPMLLFAVGIDALCERDFFGVLWIGGAGVLARFAKVGFVSAEGFKPRLVKSGDLYKRSFAMAQQMGVRLVGVFEYSTGRGRLKNAHAVSGFIGMTDVCIHYLRGPQMDFVIGHELAHLQEKHGKKELRIAASLYLAIAILALALPHLAIIWQVFLKFGVLLLPLLVIYSVSRRFEYAADRIAVEHTGEGEAAIRGLANLYYRTGVPTDCSALEELFSTHPDLSRRIEAIAQIGQVSNEVVAEIRQEYNGRSGGYGLSDAAL